MNSKKFAMTIEAIVKEKIQLEAEKLNLIEKSSTATLPL